jgi:endonuclease/exonuclease/phosphatase family metal-dependent hydrolase
MLLLLCQSLFAGCQQKTAEATPFRSGELDKYVIVYQESNSDYFDLANQLADRISEKYGVLLTVLPDVAAPNAKHEILLGDTNRDSTPSRVMEYAVTVDDGKFKISVGGSFSAEAAIAFLCKNIFTGQELTLDAGEHYKPSLLSTAHPVTEGANARIMTANVLADAFADTTFKTAHYRAEIFAGMLLTYTPDVLGLQETDENWNEVLDAYLEKLQKAHGITYARHMATYEDKANYTSLLYRADKFKVANEGMYTFSWWTDPNFRHNYHMRNITWAQFSALDNPAKRFVVANTHWSYRTEHADNKTYLSGANKPIAANELREQCKNETNTFLSTLRQEHPGMPIFLTGDFNTSLSFFTESGWTPTGFQIISEIAKQNGTSLTTVPTSGHYDHLFGAGNYTICQYSYLRDTNHLTLLTDHPFAYADIRF